MTKPADDGDLLQLSWHGDALVVAPSGTIESVDWLYIDQAAQVVLEPIRSQAVPLVVFDLEQVTYFGSVFLALLLRCQKLVKSKGGEMVLCSVTPPAKELLQITGLDMIWAIYDDRNEALAAIGA
jgi:anti-anti-sigma factor